MSIETEAVVVVGLWYDDLIDPDMVLDLVDDDRIQRFAPWFDAGNDDCVYGLTYYASDSSIELPMQDSKFKDLSKIFRKLVNQEPALILTLNVS